MTKHLDELLNTVLATNVDDEVEVLREEIEGIKAFCANRRVPFAEGVVSGSTNGLVVELDSDVDFKNWAYANKPSFVAIERKLGTLNYSKGVILDFVLNYAESVGKESDVKALQEKCKEKCIEFVVHAIFGESSVRVKYAKLSKLRALCSVEDVSEEDDDDDDDWESWAGEPYENVYLEDSEINELSAKLALHDDFCLAKTIGERKSLAARVLDKDLTDYDLDKVARESFSLYKIEVLPRRVEALISTGKDYKEIAELLGESSNKVKQLIARSRARDALKEIDES